MQTLTGHTSPETAYVVADYPYGFGLRCSILYWVESNAKGHRLWSQTSNPKKGGAWNKPKCSTYADIGAAMYLDDEGHVQWEGLTFSASAAEIASFFERFPGAVTDVVQALALCKAHTLWARMHGYGPYWTVGGAPLSYSPSERESDSADLAKLMAIVPGAWAFIEKLEAKYEGKAQVIAV